MSYDQEFISELAESLRERQKMRDLKTSGRRHKIKNIFTGARINRLNADQPTMRMSIDYDIRTSLPVLVARSRHLWQNNSYAKKFHKMLKTHVVGPDGIIFNNKAKKSGSEELYSDLNRAFEGTLAEWGKPGNCDVTGRLSWLDIQNLYIQTMSMDGEVLIREITGFDSPWGYALQFIDTSCLDFNKNEILPNGNIVKMGVEMNKWKRPVAYWFLQRNPGEYLNPPTSDTWLRVPAEEIIHHFEPEFVNQTRGFPWVHAVMVDLAMLGGAREAEVVAFRAAAAKMGLITEPEGESLEGNTEEDDETAGSGDYEIVFDAQAGSFMKLPKGYEAQFFDPKHPKGTVPEFSKSILKGTASGLGISYPSLASDLEGVNYTSIRAGFLDERDFFKYLQTAFLINRLCARVIPNMLKMAMLTGTLRASLAMFEKLYVPKFQPRTWAWVDPLKEVDSDTQELNSGFTTRTAEAAKRGLDYEEDILQVLQQEKKLEEKYDITFEPVKNKKSANIDEPEPVAPGKNGGNEDDDDD